MTGGQQEFGVRMLWYRRGNRYYEWRYGRVRRVPSRGPTEGYTKKSAVGSCLLLSCELPTSVVKRPPQRGGLRILQSSAGNNALRGNVAVAGLCGLRVNRGRGPAWRRAGDAGDGDRHVLGRAEALQRCGRSCGPAKVRTVVVGGVLLFICSEVAQVGFHCCNVGFLFRIGEFRDCDRRENT